MEDLKTVLKHLKKGKSRDPNDHANELYHIENSGDDLRSALLVLMSKIKEQLIYPKVLEHVQYHLLTRKERGTVLTTIVECLGQLC